MHAPKTWLKQIIVDIDTFSADALTGYRTLDVESNRNGCKAVHKDDDGDDDGPAASTCPLYVGSFFLHILSLNDTF